MQNDKRKGRHLTLADRVMIESLLNEVCSFSRIGQELGKSASTIRREVKKNWKDKSTKKNDCAQLEKCEMPCMRKHINWCCFHEPINDFCQVLPSR